MKWLKKDSSHNEQISTAESKPEPEQYSGHAAKSAPKPETLEQPVGNTVQASQTEPDDLEILPPEEDHGQESKLSKQSARRRDERSGQPQAGDKETGRARRTPFRKTWVGQHWKTFAILMAIFCLAFFARSFYGLEPSTEDGFILSGGSDSYYHHYVITNADETGLHHFWDNMLNYPVGTRNPRPPLYDWSVSLMGMGLSPFFDGDTFTSTFYVFIFSTAFWGALTIFPVYYLGKEAFGKKAGMISAFLLAVLPGHIQRSVLTNADHDAITLFFIVTAFFFFLKALKVMKQKDWIDSWFKPKEVLSGAKSFVVSNKSSVLYALLSGISLAGVALIWQGFAYAIVLIAVYFFVQILINRFRNVDSFGISVIYIISVGTGLLLAFPYYYLSIQIPSWFDTPAYLVLGLFAFAIILMATKKFPWFLVFSLMILIGAITVTLLYVLAPSILDSMLNALLSGGGYFINNKQYQTIAEAQAPSFSNLAMSFGVITFWLSFAGMAWAIVQLPKSWKPDFTFILLWSITSIYMAVTAARFMFNAGPAFAISAGWVIALVLGKLNFKSYITNLRRSPGFRPSQKFIIGMIAMTSILIIAAVAVSSMSDISYAIFVIGMAAIFGIYILSLISATNPSRIYSLIAVMIPVAGALFYVFAELYSDWEMTPATHGFILAILLFSYLVLYLQVRKTSFFFTMGISFLAFCVIAPNVWTGLDAGIPYETKSGYDLEIYNSLPSFIHPKNYDAENGTTWYLGAFGYSLPLNSQYWPAAYDWLATQDTEIYPAEDKPAFISWWDYGFEVVNEGKHPTVADNFLGGHQLAGNFIMAQSEADAIALLSVRILEGDWYKVWKTGSNYFSPEMLALMDSYGVSSSEMSRIFESPSDYIDVILENPHIYGLRDDDMQDVNAKYIAARVLLTQSLSEEEITQFYSDISDLTGNSIRYFSIDSRLFPFSADNTGIFYAPAKLSDHRIDDIANQPYDFWEIKAIGEYGGEYALDEIPPDVNLNQETPYKIEYKDMFYNSMLYKAFIGYSGSDIGSEQGIPGLTESLSSNPIMPGWNMTHFKLVHRTAYWNPYSAEDIQNHTDAWRAMNYWDAFENQQNGNGISDLSDRSSLYQGVMMLKYYDGAIISGKVQLEDGTPITGLTVTVTDDFSIPHQKVTTDDNGTYSIIAPFGDVTLTVSSGTVDALTMVGTELNTTKLFIHDYQAMRENEDRDSNGQPDYLITQNLIVAKGSMNGYVYWDMDSDGTRGDSDEILSNAQVVLSNQNFIYEKSAFTDKNGKYEFDILPPGSYTASINYANRTIGTQTVSVLSGQASGTNLALTVTSLTGTVTYSDGSAAEGSLVVLKMPEENIEIHTYSDANGSYSFANVIKGNYSAQAYTPSHASTQQRMQINTQENNTIDFIIYESVILQGTLYINGVPVPYATVKLAGPSSSISTTDAAGHYSVVLNIGDYTYYVSHVKNGISYSDMGQFYLGDDKILNMDLKLSCLVTGKVISYYGASSTFTQVVFDTLDQKIMLSSITDEQGDYSINLPRGTYRIQVSSGSGSYYKSHSFTRGTDTLNLALTDGSVIHGCIYWDLYNKTAINPGEGIEKARVTFTDPSGSYAQAITNDTGNFTIVLPSTTSYQISVTKNGFEPVSLGSLTPLQLSKGLYQSLEPIPVTFAGSVYLKDEILRDQNILISFISDNIYIPSVDIQAARDGSYSATLIPSIYYVSFTHNISFENDTRVYQIDNEFAVDTGLYSGEILEMDLTAVERTKVTVSISNTIEPGANISFRMGPEEVYFNIEGFSDDIYIMPGSYILSASQALNDTFMVGMIGVDINDTAGNFTVNMTAGLEITGTVSYVGNAASNQKVIFKDVTNNATIFANTDETGTYFTVLVPNHRYEVTVNFTGFDEIPYLRAYRYFFAPTILNATTSLTTYHIELNRDNYSIELAGKVTANEVPASGTLLTFISEFANYTASTDSTGDFIINIPPAYYKIYAHQSSSHYVFLGEKFIDVDQEPLEFQLEIGNRIYGTAYYDLSENAVTSLIFTNDDGLTLSNYTDENGYYELWLPSGDYRITSSLQIQKNSIPMTYSLNIDITLERDRQVNLPLSMIEERIVFVSYNPSQLTATPGNVTKTYIFEVENTGNIQDTYGLTGTGGNPDWAIELSQYQVTLDPGASVRLTATVSIPASPRVDQNQVTLTATSQKNTSIWHSQVMNVPITQFYSLSVNSIALSPKFTSGDIISSFKISNTGNGADKLTVYIANIEDLALSGWEAELGSVSGASVAQNGMSVTNVTVAYGSSVTVPLSVKPINNVPSRQASVLVVAYSQADPTFVSSSYIVLKYPEIQVASQNLTATGVEVSSDAGNQLTNAGVMVASVACALLIFYYARRKRWIR